MNYKMELICSKLKMSTKKLPLCGKGMLNAHTMYV